MLLNSLLTKVRWILIMIIKKYISQSIRTVLLVCLSFVWLLSSYSYRGCRGRDRMGVGFTISYAYHHKSWKFESRSWRGVLDTILCDRICQWLATGRWFYLGTAVSSSNKTDRHDISEILLKVAVKYYTSHTALLHQYTNTRIIHLVPTWSIEDPWIRWPSSTERTLGIEIEHSFSTARQIKYTNLHLGHDFLITEELKIIPAGRYCIPYDLLKSLVHRLERFWMKLILHARSKKDCRTIISVIIAWSRAVRNPMTEISGAILSIGHYTGVLDYVFLFSWAFKIQ